MKNSTQKILLTALGVALGSLAHAQSASPAVNLSNVAQLSAEGAVEVQQDLLRITLSTTRQGADARDVQGQLKQALDAALQTAKSEAAAGQLDVRTGNFSLYPTRNTKEQISGWQGTADMVISGRDIPRISAVAGKIRTLTISDIGFDLSPELRQKTESEAQAKAIAAFRQKAEDITRTFGFRSYTLREVNVNADNSYGGGMPRMGMVKSAAYAAEAPVPTEPGKSNVRVTVHGSVQMQ